MGGLAGRTETTISSFKQFYVRSIKMNKKTKLSCIFSLIVLFLFLSSNVPFCDAQGIPDPSKRAPASANAKKKPAPAKKSSPPKKAAPKTPAPPEQQPAVLVCDSLYEAISLIEDERYQKALYHIVCAVKKQPLNPDAWYWFGVWNNKTGNFSNAQKYFAKALEIDPYYPALSRVVVYPDDPYEKNPLWDPRRPTELKGFFPLKEINVVAPGSPESLSEPRPETEDIVEMPVYLPPDPY